LHFCGFVRESFADFANFGFILDFCAFLWEVFADFGGF